MHAITIREPGGPEVLEWSEVADPRPGPGEVLIDVAAGAVNRADVMQRQGNYPPPPGASEILGLECSGTVAELGEGVGGFRPGDEVCALLSGGGYAERVAVPAGQVLALPQGVDLVTAAGLPEVSCTVWSMVVAHAELGPGDVLLVHGGSGGIGTHAIQVGKARGATVAVTAGSPERSARCAELGADITIDYHSQDFVTAVKDATGGRGADVVLDNIGAKYLAANIDVLARDGRLVVIGLQGGATGELPLGKMLGKRLQVYAAGLRGRPAEDKAHIVRGVHEGLWPMIGRGAVRPVIHEVVPMAEAARAHRDLEQHQVFGKVVLRAR
jgi:putative PIG3 family NAD(P)H quinone oxidoreductase